MASSWFTCKPCSESDPTSDTVKVNPALLNKENMSPLLFDQKTAEEQKLREQVELAERRLKEEAAAAAVADAARIREEGERVTAEIQARRQEARRQEAARREAAEREAAERVREEEQAEAAAKEAAAAAAAAAEEQRKCEEAEKAAEEQAKLEAEKQATEFCKKNGFQDVHTQKKTLRGATKFPLHTAVKHNDQEVIAMLLLAGARKDVKDSNNRTPSELAAKLNKNGSHDQLAEKLR